MAIARRKATGAPSMPPLKLDLEPEAGVTTWTLLPPFRPARQPQP